MVEDLVGYWATNLKKNYTFLSAVIGDILSSVTIIVFSGILYDWSLYQVLANLLLVVKSGFIIFITLIFKGEMINQDQVNKTLAANVQVAEAKFDAKCQEVELMQKYNEQTTDNFNKLAATIEVLKDLADLKKV